MASDEAAFFCGPEDFHPSEWVKDGEDWNYDPQGGLGHRLRQGEEMYCGVSIPREFWGGGQAVVPYCPVCWPEGSGA